MSLGFKVAELSIGFWTSHFYFPMQQSTHPQRFMDYPVHYPTFNDLSQRTQPHLRIQHRLQCQSVERKLQMNNIESLHFNNYQ
jgi:hypothetical protein